MQKEKLLNILHYPPPIHGAAIVGKYIKDSEAINTTFNSKYINLSTSKSIDDIGSNNPLKIFRYVNIIFSSLSKLIFWKPNLVYLTISSRGGGLIKDLPLVFLCKLFRKKHVFHFHNKGVRNYAENHKWGDRMYRWLFKEAKVILLSPHLYKDISNYVDKKNVYYCANGIESIAQPEKIKAKNDKPISILFLSNLIRSKGIFDLLEACEKLKADKIAFECTIIGGEGDLTAEELKSKIDKLSLAESVSYAGKKYGEEKIAFFEKADVFVHPTQEDCFPLVLLEAMQFGLPIISTDEGAITEIVDHDKTGLIISKGNTEELFRSIKSYADNPEVINQHGEHAREKFEQQYTVDKFEHRITSIFNKILNE